MKKKGNQRYCVTKRQQKMMLLSRLKLVFFVFREHSRSLPAPFDFVPGLQADISFPSFRSVRFIFYVLVSQTETKISARVGES